MEFNFFICNVNDQDKKIKTLTFNFQKVIHLTNARGLSSNKQSFYLVDAKLWAAP